MKCPECAKEIFERSVCRCGWKQGVFDSPKFINCAYENCAAPSIARIETKLGVKNMCDFHITEYRTRASMYNLPTWGMEKLASETNDEWVLRMRQFVREKARGVNKSLETKT
jgi:hypothetical protein